MISMLCKSLVAFEALVYGQNAVAYGKIAVACGKNAVAYGKIAVACGKNAVAFKPFVALKTCRPSSSLVCVSILPKRLSDRVIGMKYLYRGKPIYWSGKYILCEHKKRRTQCRGCNSSCICSHGKRICSICHPKRALAHTMRCRTTYFTKNYNHKRANNTIEYLGVTIYEFRKYMEAQFQPGMTWENLGKWHIDHIRPCASFDLSNEAEREMCFHFTNMQPMWAYENQRKSSKYDEETHPKLWDPNTKHWLPK